MILLINRSPECFNPSLIPSFSLLVVVGPVVATLLLLPRAWLHFLVTINNYSLCLFYLFYNVASMPAPPVDLPSMEEEENAQYSLEDFAASYNNETKVKAMVF